MCQGNAESNRNSCVAEMTLLRASVHGGRPALQTPHEPRALRSIWSRAVLGWDDWRVSLHGPGRVGVTGAFVESSGRSPQAGGGGRKQACGEAGQQLRLCMAGTRTLGRWSPPLVRGSERSQQVSSPLPPTGATGLQ